MSRVSPKYRSKLEVQFAAFLTANGIKFKYEQGKIKYLVKVRSGTCATCGGKNVLKHRSYLPDFRAGKFVLETKGRLTSAERTKFAAIAAGTADLVLVFQRDNPIRKGSSTKYSDWARENGIRFHVGVGLPADVLADLKTKRKYAVSTTPKVTATYRTKKSGPTMAGTKKEKKGGKSKAKNSASRH